MKRLALVFLLAIVVAFLIVVSRGKAEVSHKQTAVVTFTEKVKLMDVFLKGQYLFVHDEDKMAQGEDCTYIYNYVGGQAGKLVASFHCVPAARPRADHFTIVTTRLLPDLSEVREYQFGGSTEAHQVPTAVLAR